MFKRILFLAVFLSLISSMFFTVNVQAKSNLSVEWEKPYIYCSEKEFQAFPVMSIHKQTIFTYLKVFYSNSFAVNQSNQLFGSIRQTITDWYGSLHIRVSSTILTYICIFLILVIILLVVRTIGIFGFKNWEARGNIGPLIIEEINDHPGFSLMLKKYLCNCGAKLSNPTNTSAPSSTPGFSSVKAALEATNESQGKILAAIFEICSFIVSLLGLKKNGYTITSAFPEDDDQGSVKSYIEIKYLFNNKLVMSNALEAVTYDELLKKSAYWIFWSISHHKTHILDIPKWSVFPTFESFYEYKLASEKTFPEANDNYAKAVKLAPFNALIKLGWGDINELNNKYIDALEIYLETILLWPHLYGVWFRIGAIFSCPKETLDDQWKALGQKRKQRIIKLIKEVLTANCGILFADDQTISCLDFPPFSLLIWLYLENQISGMVSLWLTTVLENCNNRIFNRVKYDPDLAKYYWRMISIFEWQHGTKFRNSVILARFCTEIEMCNVVYQNNLVKAITEQVDLIVNKTWNDMDIFYNAACYYAILGGKFSAVSQKSIINESHQYLQTSIKYLKTAFNDKNSDLDPEWVRNDPDLISLYSLAEFRALFDKPSQEEQKEEFITRSTDMRTGFYLLHKVSKHQIKEWKYLSRHTMDLQSLIAISEYQIDLWNNLQTYMDGLEDSINQDAFWIMAMQNEEPIPKPHCPAISIIIATSLGDLSSTRKEIKNIGQVQSNTWKKRLEDVKLFVSSENKTKDQNLLKIWGKSELWQWDCIDQKISKVIKLTK